MATMTPDLVRFVNTAACASDCYDCTVIVGEKCDPDSYPSFVHATLEEVKKLNECDANEDVSVCMIPNSSEQNESCGDNQLIIWSPTGPINRDYDDVRRYREAASTGLKRALKGGKKKPLLVVSDSHQATAGYGDGLLVSLLGALEAVYVPIEVREALPEKTCKVSVIGIASNQLDTEEKAERLMHDAMGLEFGRIICRDIGGSDPERMGPGMVEDYLRQTFNNTCIKMSVVAGHQSFVKDYPLFAAVDRCADTVHRHQGRIIYLEYTGEEVEKTYMFVGECSSFLFIYFVIRKSGPNLRLKIPNFGARYFSEHKKPPIIVAKYHGNQ
jgi:leucyl aminopeptidase